MEDSSTSRATKRANTTPAATATATSTTGAISMEFNPKVSKVASVEPSLVARVGVEQEERYGTSTDGIAATAAPTTSLSRATTSPVVSKVFNPNASAIAPVEPSTKLARLDKAEKYETFKRENASSIGAAFHGRHDDNDNEEEDDDGLTGGISASAPNHSPHLGLTQYGRRSSTGDAHTARDSHDLDDYFSSFRRSKERRREPDGSIVSASTANTGTGTTNTGTHTNTSQVDADARIKAGLRRKSRRGNPSTSTTPGAVQQRNSRNRASTSALSVESQDAQIKAGLRRHSRHSHGSAQRHTKAGAGHGSADFSKEFDDDSCSEASSSMVGAVFVKHASPLAPGAVSSKHTPPHAHRAESDYLAKAGLRNNNHNHSPTRSITSASTSQSRSHSPTRSISGASTASAASTMTADSDALAKRGLRGNSAAHHGVVGAHHSTPNSSRLGAHHGLRRSRREIEKFGMIATQNEAQNASASAIALHFKADESGDDEDDYDDQYGGDEYYGDDPEMAVNAMELGHPVRVEQDIVVIAPADDMEEGAMAINYDDNRNTHDPEINLADKPPCPPPPSFEPVHQATVQPQIAAVYNTSGSDDGIYVDETNDDIDQQNKSKRKMPKMFIPGLVLIIIVAIIVGIVVGTKSSSKNNKDEDASATNATANDQPPIDDDNVKLKDIFPTTNTLLTEDTIQAIQSQQQRLPQVQAIQWLLQDPNLQQYYDNDNDAQLMQRFALACFYYATNGAEWFQNADADLQYLDNWLQYEVHECQWFSLAEPMGYTVCEGYIPSADDESMTYSQHYDYTSVSLTGDPNVSPIAPRLRLYQQVKGFLVPELALLTSLQRLDVGLQNLRREIPQSLGQLSSTLRHLLLYGNQLTGTIPESILTFPQIIYMGHNDFARSPIPSEIGLNSNLQFLNLIKTMRTGSIPSEFYQLTALQEARLGENFLTGALSTDLGQLTALRQLLLTDNRLSQEIPSTIGLLTNLVVLEININQITGPIKTEMGLLTSLRSLYLGSNKFTGTLPSELAQLRLLQDFRISQDLQDNRGLNGTIPIEYFVWPGLVELPDNTTTGTNGGESSNSTPAAGTAAAVSVATPTFPNLLHFRLDHTSISGTIPSQLALLTNLQTIHLGSNPKMLGWIPTQIALLSNSLQELLLDDSNLRATIPTELGQLTKLVNLQLQRNNLNGEIPAQLGALVPSLKQFRVDGNARLSGVVPQSLCVVETLGLGCQADKVPNPGEATQLCGCHCPCQ